MLWEVKNNPEIEKLINQFDKFPLISSAAEKNWLIINFLKNHFKLLKTTNI